MKGRSQKDASSRNRPTELLVINAIAVLVCVLKPIVDGCQAFPRTYNIRAL